MPHLRAWRWVILEFPSWSSTAGCSHWFWSYVLETWRPGRLLWKFHCLVLVSLPYLTKLLYRFFLSAQSAHSPGLPLITWLILLCTQLAFQWANTYKWLSDFDQCYEQRFPTSPVGISSGKEIRMAQLLRVGGKLWMCVHACVRVRVLVCAQCLWSASSFLIFLSSFLYIFDDCWWCASWAAADVELLVDRHPLSKRKPLLLFCCLFGACC